MSDVAAKIVDRIINDLSSRCGLEDEWEQIDEDIQQEIKDEWGEIVDRVLSDAN